MKFNIGHTIILRESPLTGFYFTRHIGHMQRIIRNHNGDIHTEFLEGPNKGLSFNFHEYSDYAKYCEVSGLMSHNIKQFSFV